MSQANDAGIEPFYFGPADRALFGLHHRPSGTARGALLLCSPHGHEYIQFHRVCRLLAILLAEAGFHVLRFDVAGCGDSAGDEADWGLERWIADTELAAEELRRRAGDAPLGAVGLRLGASLAARFGAARQGALRWLVLWDPVFDGTDYLAELNKLQGEMLRYAHVKPRAEGEPEALGFALPSHLTDGLASLDLCTQMDRPAERVLLIESHDAVPQDRMLGTLRAVGTTVDHQRFSNPHLWVWTEDFAKVHVPRRILDAIVAWTTESRP